MSAARYATPRRALHWVVAAILVTTIPIGIVFTDFDNKPWAEATFGAGSFDWFYDFHKALGVTALALMAVRIWAKRRWPDPAYVPPLDATKARLAGAAHLSLYVLLVVVPLLGWLGVSAYPAPVPLLGFQIPLPVEPNRALAERALAMHGTLALLTTAIIVIHIAAALHHRFALRDGVFARMASGDR